MSLRRFFCAIFLIAMSAHAFAQAGAGASPPPEQHDTRQQDAEAETEAVRKEVEEAAQAIGEYTSARRDEALRRAGTAIGRLDRRMAELREDWDRRLKGMSSDTRARSERAMADLQRRRDDLDARYEAMRRSSEEAWEDNKTGFVRAYRMLADTMRQMRADEQRAQEGPANAADEPEEEK
jgi:uncharacterized protein YukE